MTELLHENSDADLIARVRDGDADAYGDLFSRHSRAAQRLATQIAGHGDADDLVAEAFLKVLRVLQSGGGPDAAFRAYLLTAVRRLHVDRVRAGTRTQLTDDLEPFDPGVPFVDTAVAGFEGGAAARAFASLPERWQLVLWHLEVEGQKPADIAPLLGMTPNSVSALAYRAREGLRQAFLQMHSADAVDPDCRWTHDRLGAYVRQGLSRRDVGKVETHLDECERCSAILLEFRSVNDELAAVLAPLLLGAAAAGYLGGASGSLSLGALLGRTSQVLRGNAATLAGTAAIGLVVLGGTATVSALGHGEPADVPVAHSALPATAGAAALADGLSERAVAGDAARPASTDRPGGDRAAEGFGPGRGGSSQEGARRGTGGVGPLDTGTLETGTVDPGSGSAGIPGADDPGPGTIPGGTRTEDPPGPSGPASPEPGAPTSTTGGQPTVAPGGSIGGPGSGTTSGPSTPPDTAPTSGMTQGPTEGPTSGATTGPTSGPTSGVVIEIGTGPTDGPTSGPTSGVVIEIGTGPTDGPTSGPTSGPTDGPTYGPTEGPTYGPTYGPSDAPTYGPTDGPTGPGPTTPTHGPTVTVTTGPTYGPTYGPTDPASTGSGGATSGPGGGSGPSADPSSGPTTGATGDPTSGPSDVPTTPAPTTPNPTTPAPTTPAPTTSAPTTPAPAGPGDLKVSVRVLDSDHSGDDLVWTVTGTDLPAGVGATLVITGTRGVTLSQVHGDCRGSSDSYACSATTFPATGTLTANAGRAGGTVTFTVVATDLGADASPDDNVLVHVIGAV